MTIAAQIIFIEDPRGGRWTACFLNAYLAEGQILGRSVNERHTSVILTIKEITATDGPTRYEWTTPGEHTHNGNRHHVAYDLTDAQTAVIKWASRRFRQLVEQ